MGRALFAAWQDAWLSFGCAVFLNDAQRRLVDGLEAALSEGLRSGRVEARLVDPLDARDAPFEYRWLDCVGARLRLASGLLWFRDRALAPAVFIPDPPVLPLFSDFALMATPGRREAPPFGSFMGRTDHTWLLAEARTFRATPRAFEVQVKSRQLSHDVFLDECIRTLCKHGAEFARIRKKEMLGLLAAVEPATKAKEVAARLAERFPFHVRARGDGNMSWREHPADSFEAISARAVANKWSKARRERKG